MKNPMLLILFASCFSANIYCQTTYHCLDSLFNSLYNNKQINGNVLIAEKGQIIYQKSFGYSDLQQQEKNTEHSRFQIGSVSKIFTAIAILQLGELGNLKLEDHLVLYFPDFPYPDVTIYELLAHTSGIPDKEDLFLPIIEREPDRVFTNKDIIPAMKALNKQAYFTPGSQWRYCNIGYALLALLVEKISKVTFDDYLKQHIFLPAGMKHSYLLHTNETSPDEVKGYLIRAHYLGDMETIDSSKKVHSWSHNMRGFVGCTNIISTTQDMLNFDAALTKNKLLKPETMVKMQKSSKLSNGTSTVADGEFGKASYGLGWFIMKDTTSGKIVMHTGREPGFFTFFLCDLTHQRTIIILDNMESPGFGKACKESFNLLSQIEYFPEMKHKESLFLAYAKKLYSEGADEAITLFNLLRSDTAHYFADERELNELGLEFLNDKQYGAALEALKLCTILYPESWNTYDSYGKALFQSGKKKEAILMYRKSVDMNAQNVAGKKILEQLLEK
jgi:CubicO group peptidase (beta-lactamase class C family)